MTRRTFLHVATTKSGTTFLQAILWAHRDRLLDQGVLLPGERKQHFLAALDVRDEARFGGGVAAVEGSWAGLVDATRAWDGDAVVSHELFAPASKEQASRAIAELRDTEVHVVVTARDLSRQIPAEWQEHLKHRSVLTFPEFLTSLRADRERGPYSPNGYYFWQEQDLGGIVDRWGAQLPVDRIHVVTVPPAGAPPETLWRRFAALIGIDSDGMDLTAGRPNQSVRAEQAEVLRRLNGTLGSRLPLPGAYPGTVKAVLAHQILAGRQGTRVGVLGDDLAFAIQVSQEMVAELQRRGVDVVGDLHDLESRAEESVVSGDAAVSPDDVLDEAVEALAEVLHRFSAERARRRQLRTQLDEALERVRELGGRPST